MQSRRSGAQLLRLVTIVTAIVGLLSASALAAGVGASGDGGPGAYQLDVSGGGVNWLLALVSLSSVAVVVGCLHAGSIVARALSHDDPESTSPRRRGPVAGLSTMVPLVAPVAVGFLLAATENGTDSTAMN